MVFLKFLSSWYGSFLQCSFSYGLEKFISIWERVPHPSQNISPIEKLATTKKSYFYLLFLKLKGNNNKLSGFMWHFLLFQASFRLFIFRLTLMYNSEEKVNTPPPKKKKLLVLLPVRISKVWATKPNGIIFLTHNNN